MSAMRARKVVAPKSALACLITLILSFTVLIPVQAATLDFNSSPAKKWGHIYASAESQSNLQTSPRSSKLEGEVKSEWRVTYNDFPTEAR
ncbi:MAG: hypothetical protein RIS57_90, partial [Actinomycetota bacterium]